CPPNLPALPHLPILRPIFLLGTPHPPSELSPLGSSPFSALLDRVSSQRPGRTTHRPIFILRFCPITAQYHTPSSSRCHSNWHRIEFVQKPGSQSQSPEGNARAEHRQRRGTLLQTIYHRPRTRQPVHDAPSSIT
ncbi:uncharacterized protein CCOS01_04667, partial [Colletotrichum costaricense]